MSDTTLRQAFGNIADAIRAKGVTGTMTPLEMPTKISSIQTDTRKYGVGIDGMFGDVDSNGVLQQPSQSFTFSSSDIIEIPS